MFNLTYNGDFLTYNNKFLRKIESNLIAYYPFNGNANDYSGNKNNGEITGATLISDRFGNSNSAYYFDGDDLIQGKFNNPSDTFTITVWFNTTVPVGRYHGIFGFSDSNGIRHELYVDNTYRLRLFIPGKYYMSETLNGNINNGDWHFISGGYNSNDNEYFFYYDGSYLGTSSQTNYNTPHSIGNFRIGHILFTELTSTYYAIGSIDDIRIYNKYLSKSELDVLNSKR